MGGKRKRCELPRPLPSPTEASLVGVWGCWWPGPFERLKCTVGGCEACPSLEFSSLVSEYPLISHAQGHHSNLGWDEFKGQAGSKTAWRRSRGCKNEVEA